MLPWLAAVVACGALVGPVAVLWPARPDGQHDHVPARPGERHVARGQPAAGPRPRRYRPYRAYHRRGAARAGLAVSRRLAGRPPAQDRAVRRLAAHHRPDADVHAGAGYPVRLLHLPGVPAALAGDLAAGAAGGPRSRPHEPAVTARGSQPGGQPGLAPVLGSGQVGVVPPASPRTRRRTRAGLPPAGRCGHGLLVVGALLGERQVPQGLHIARPVGQLDQDGVAAARPAAVAGRPGGPPALLSPGAGNRDRHPADELGHPAARTPR